jgi:hypothetical protein
MSYIDIVICTGPDRILETWQPIYRGQERPVRDRLRVSQVDHHVYSRYTPCLTDLIFEFIQRPIPLILSPSSRTFVKLTLVNDSLRVFRVLAGPIYVPTTNAKLLSIPNGVFFLAIVPFTKE